LKIRYGVRRSRQPAASARLFRVNFLIASVHDSTWCRLCINPIHGSSPINATSSAPSGRVRINAPLSSPDAIDVRGDCAAPIVRARRISASVQNKGVSMPDRADQTRCHSIQHNVPTASASAGRRGNNRRLNSHALQPEPVSVSQPRRRVQVR